VRQPRSSTPLTHVAQEIAKFSRDLEQQFAATINERLSARLDTEAFHIAEHEVQQMATALGMDAGQIAVKLATGFSLSKFQMRQQFSISIGERFTPNIQTGETLQ
jgi:hypothetical protein